MPKYVLALLILQASIIFVPEKVWLIIGLDASIYENKLPRFVEYYVDGAFFKNSMLAFWLVSPLTLLINTVLFVVHVNYAGYRAYLARRVERLRKQNKTSDYSLVAGAVVMVSLYVWSTVFYLSEPGVLGSAVPTKSRLAMVVIHAASVALLIPVCLTVLLTELRANFSGLQSFGDKK
jgi:hypothetical protein